MPEPPRHVLILRFGSSTMDIKDDNTYESLLEANGILPQTNAQVVIDQNVITELAKRQPGVQIVAATGYGASFWTRTARIETRLNDGTRKAYFLKVANGEGAKEMMHGEFESQSAMHRIVPSFVPTPLAWGTFAADPESHFFICDFVEMTEEIPRPTKFCAKLASLHLQSMDQNPNGKFGFDITTCQGNILLNNDWCDTWEEFFSRALKDMISTEAKAQGPCKEIDELQIPLTTKVIPRLLRPLQSGGRTIRPCLVHGDLWHGNTSVAADTDEPYVFDSCVLWAHNEYEMGMWRATRYKFGRSYLREYQKHVPVSAPEEDWDDRNALYGIRTDLLCSALYGSNQNFRRMAIAEMSRLVNKYPDGFEGFQDNSVSRSPFIGYQG